MNKPLTRMLMTGALLLTACDNHNATDTSDSIGVTTQTPALLRALPVANLTAIVTVNSSPTTYEGSAFPDGNWVLSLPLEDNRQHSIFIEWMQADILLMEERGSFFADPADRTIELELDFITAGYIRFDYDCDGVPNLDELLISSDPGSPDNTSDSECRDDLLVPPDPARLETPWVVQASDSFISNPQINPLIRKSQPLRVMTINASRSSAYGTTLSTERVDPADRGEEYETLLTEFYYHPDLGRSVRVAASNATASGLLTVPGADCVPRTTTGVFCQIPFDWKVQHWYEFVVEQTSANGWQVILVDRELEQSTELVLINTDIPRVWNDSSVGLSYKYELPASDCSQSLSPITLQYRDGVANAGIAVSHEQSYTSNCVQYGGGSNYSVRTIDDQQLHSLTLGVH